MIALNSIVAFVYATIVIPLLALVLFVAFVPANFLALPADVVNGLSYLVGIALAFDFIFPIHTLLTGWLFLIAVDTVMYTWTAFRWFIALMTHGLTSGL